jgi:hypothetical protein
LEKRTKNIKTALEKWIFVAGRDLILQITANLAKIWISGSIVASLPPQTIGNYKIDMQPIRLTYKSLLPERLFGRTDALYIGLMRL